MSSSISVSYTVDGVHFQISFWIAGEGKVDFQIFKSDALTFSLGIPKWLASSKIVIYDFIKSWVVETYCIFYLIHSSQFGNTIDIDSINLSNSAEAVASSSNYILEIPFDTFKISVIETTS